LVKHDHDITGLWFDPVRKRYIGVLSTIRQEYTGGITHLDSRQTRLSMASWRAARCWSAW
jgi:hypothetical protein